MIQCHPNSIPLIIYEIVKYTEIDHTENGLKMAFTKTDLSLIVYLTQRFFDRFWMLRCQKVSLAMQISEAKKFQL